MKNKEIKDVLNIKFDSDPFGEISIKGYLLSLLKELWVKKDRFSGKRPFGDSGWEYELYECLAVNNVINADITEEDGAVHDYNKLEADVVILNCIEDLLENETVCISHDDKNSEGYFFEVEDLH